MFFIFYFLFLLFQHLIRRHRGLHEDELEQDGLSAGRPPERPLRPLRLPLHSVRMRKDFHPRRLLLLRFRFVRIVQSKMLKAFQMCL